MLLDGKKIANKLEERLKTELLFQIPKRVCFVIFESTPATEQFVKIKSRVAERIGIVAITERHTEAHTTEQIVAVVIELGKKKYDGIVVQLPLPAGVDTEKVLDAVPFEQDIDVLGSATKRSYENGDTHRIPPVARAVHAMLESCGATLSGKNIVVIGRGRLVGEPVHLMLKQMGLPHIVIDILTGEKEKLSTIKQADVIISGVGVPCMIKPSMIKKGVLLIDAGTSEQGGKLVGDVDPTCEALVSHMTPVPGGVGPVTVVALLQNLV